MQESTFGKLYIPLFHLRFVKKSIMIVDDEYCVNLKFTDILVSILVGVHSTGDWLLL